MEMGHFWFRPYNARSRLLACYTVPVDHQSHHFIMTLKFDRIQAGEYQINDGPNMVGYVRKQNASKWVMYKCSNPSLLGNPIAVKKTLKELKAEAETLIGSTYVEPVKAPSAARSTGRATVKMDPEKRRMMQEMIDNSYVISLKEYKHTEDGLVEFPSKITEKSTEEELMAL